MKKYAPVSRPALAWVWQPGLGSFSVAGWQENLLSGAQDLCVLGVLLGSPDMGRWVQLAHKTSLGRTVKTC